MVGICLAVAALVLLVWLVQFIGAWVYIYKSRHVRAPFSLWQRNVKEAEMKRLQAEANKGENTPAIVELPPQEELRWLAALKRKPSAPAADEERGGQQDTAETANAAIVILTNYRDARRQFKRFSDKNVATVLFLLFFFFPFVSKRALAHILFARICVECDVAGELRAARCCCCCCCCCSAAAASAVRCLTPWHNRPDALSPSFRRVHRLLRLQKGRREMVPDAGHALGVLQSGMVRIPSGRKARHAPAQLS